MAESLQDQLKALGLAKDRPRKARKRRPAKKTPPGKTTVRDDADSLEQAYRLKERQEQSQADRARQRKQAEDLERRLLNQSIKKIVKPHRLNVKDAELSRNFLFKGRIRKISVTAEQIKELNAGSLGIVYLSGSYHLLPADKVEEVRKLSADHVPELKGGADDDGEHPVPDDLVW